MSLFKLADDEITPVAACPFGRLLLEDGPALSAPRAEKKPFPRNPDGGLEIIGVEYVVIIDKNEQVALCLADTAQTGGGQAEGFFSDHPRARMPREVDLRIASRSTGVVNDEKLPSIPRENLRAQSLHRRRQIIGTGIVGAEDEGRYQEWSGAEHGWLIGALSRVVVEEDGYSCPPSLPAKSPKLPPDRRVTRNDH